MNETIFAPHARSASVLIIVATLLSFIPIFFDPVTGGDGPNEYLRSMSSVRLIKAFVFGPAIASLVAYMIGFLGLAVHLGSRRVLVLVATGTYLFGCFAIICASFGDGFVSVAISNAFADAPLEEAKMAFNSFIVLAIACDVTAHFGWFMQAIATLLFSVCLIQSRGIPAIVGIIGLCVASVTMASLFGLFPNPLFGIRAIYVAEGIWGFAIALVLWRSEVKTHSVS